MTSDELHSGKKETGNEEEQGGESEGQVCRKEETLTAS
jgi:hypothetical protein